MLLFPRYVSAIDEERNLATLKIILKKHNPVSNIYQISLEGRYSRANLQKNHLMPYQISLEGRYSGVNLQISCNNKK